MNEHAHQGRTGLQLAASTAPQIVNELKVHSDSYEPCSLINKEPTHPIFLCVTPGHNLLLLGTDATASNFRYSILSQDFLFMAHIGAEILGLVPMFSRLNVDPEEVSSFALKKSKVSVILFFFFS